MIFYAATVNILPFDRPAPIDKSAYGRTTGADEAEIRAPASTREIRAQMRQILLLIHEFRLLCNRRADSRLLIGKVDAVIRCSKGAFDPTVMSRLETARPPTDVSRCLDDLDSLRRALRARRHVSAQELLHSMDSLIVECVRLDPGDEHV